LNSLVILVLHRRLHANKFVNLLSQEDLKDKLDLCKTKFDFRFIVNKFTKIEHVLFSVMIIIVTK